MTVMLDSNVLIDALAARKPFDVDAQNILRASARGEYTCCFTVNSATDIFYVLKKTKGLQIARDAIKQLLRLIPAVSISAKDCLDALGLPFDDFEDALLAVCAKKVDADYIVTRDQDFMEANLPVKVISPAEFLKSLK